MLTSLATNSFMRQVLLFSIDLGVLRTHDHGYWTVFVFEGGYLLLLVCRLFLFLRVIHFLRFSVANLLRVLVVLCLIDYVFSLLLRHILVRVWFVWGNLLRLLVLRVVDWLRRERNKWVLKGFNQNCPFLSPPRDLTSWTEDLLLAWFFPVYVLVWN